jgi:hypothetical protein
VIALRGVPLGGCTRRPWREPDLGGGLDAHQFPSPVQPVVPPLPWRTRGGRPLPALCCSRRICHLPGSRPLAHSISIAASLLSYAAIASSVTGRCDAAVTPAPHLGGGASLYGDCRLANGRWSRNSPRWNARDRSAPAAPRCGPRRDHHSDGLETCHLTRAGIGRAERPEVHAARPGEAGGAAKARRKDGRSQPGLCLDLLLGTAGARASVSLQNSKAVVKFFGLPGRGTCCEVLAVRPLERVQ